MRRMKRLNAGSARLTWIVQDMDGAMQHYKHALQMQPDDPEANEGLGMVLMSAKSYQDALVYLKRAVEFDPTDGPPYYHLALADRDLGDLDVANREMEEFRKLTTEKDNLSTLDLHGRSAQTTDSYVPRGHPKAAI
jgi:tetratricopeptide (TPR) repeat protein